MGLLGKLGVVSAAVSFARSERGQKAIQEARQRFDTPENRQKLREGLTQATGQVKRAAAKRSA